MKAEFEKSKNITWLDTTVKIMSSLSEENIKELDQMAEELNMQSKHSIEKQTAWNVRCQNLRL